MIAGHSGTPRNPFPLALSPIPTCVVIRQLPHPDLCTWSHPPLRSKQHSTAAQRFNASTNQVKTPQACNFKPVTPASPTQNLCLQPRTQRENPPRTLGHTVARLSYCPACCSPDVAPATGRFHQVTQFPNTCCPSMLLTRHSTSYRQVQAVHTICQAGHTNTYCPSMLLTTTPTTGR